MTTQPIRLNERGERIRAHQRHLNDRLSAHGDRQIVVSGTCDHDTIDATARAAWFLGALMDNVRKVQRGTIPVGVERMVADPDTRDRPQRRRARERRGVPFPGPRFTIVTCSQWGARAPKRRIIRVGRPSKIIFHHTDGHHPEIDLRPGDSLAEAKAFAQAIQNHHMDVQGSIDSGHNFLVTRSGHILEGRHGSLAAIKAGAMVESAHCVGQNHHPGIEHEHRGAETMTPIQREASLFLHELICRRTGIEASAIRPHKQFDNTACPAELLPALPRFRADLAKRLAS